MANSNIRLYQNCVITPEKLFRVDDLELYLNTLTSILKEDFQYVKHQLKLNIVVNMSQYGLAFNMNNFNYLKIENDSDSLGVAFPVYYFIVNKKWTSMEAVTLELEMDTLNTFTETNNSFEWDNKTKINRQHKDRYYRDGNEIFPIIDKIYEDINPILFKTYDLPVLNSDFDTDWYLIYINSTTQENSAVNCLVVPGQDLITRRANPDVAGRIYPIMLLENEYYYKKGEDNMESITFTLSNGISITITDHFKKVIFYKVGNKIIFSWFQLSQYGFIKEQFVIDWFSISTTLNCKYSGVLKVAQDEYSYDGEISATFYSSTYPDILLDDIEWLDRTDSKLIKVIKLPYSPSKFDISNGRLNSIPNDYEIIDMTIGDRIFTALKIKNLSISFKHSLRFYSSPLAILNAIDKPQSLEIIANQLNDTDDEITETKMYNSEFYNETFVYDTFRFTYQLEYVYSLNHYVEYMDIDFIVTTTMNSKFMFKFTDYDTPQYDTSDYNNILVIGRNNELPLYNSAYLNYIRNGINYDVKTKERNETSSWLGVGLTIGGSVLSAIFGGAFGVAGAIALGTSATAQIANAINSTQQADQNMKQKIEQYRNQSVSVSGSDDVDLMSNYCKNRLQKMYYEPSSEMKSLIKKLFYYSGYKDNTFGVPNLNTRYWFNFIMCDLVMKSTSNISEEIKKELINKYSLGVTVFHNRGTQITGEWNFEQTKENIEMSLEYHEPPVENHYIEVTSINDIQVGRKVLFTTKPLTARNGGGILKISRGFPNSISKTITSSSFIDDGSLDIYLFEVLTNDVSNGITFKKYNGTTSQKLSFDTSAVPKPAYSSNPTMFEFVNGALKVKSANEWFSYLIVNNKADFVKSLNLVPYVVKLYYLDE